MLLCTGAPEPVDGTEKAVIWRFMNKRLTMPDEVMRVALYVASKVRVVLRSGHFEYGVVINLIKLYEELVACAEKYHYTKDDTPDKYAWKAVVYKLSAEFVSLVRVNKLVRVCLPDAEMASIINLMEMEYNVAIFKVLEKLGAGPYFVSPKQLDVTTPETEPNGPVNFVLANRLYNLHAALFDSDLGLWSEPIPSPEYMQDSPDSLM